MPLSSEQISVLKNTFKVGRFRPGQLECIDALVDGRDTWASMPCGAGKTLVFAAAAQTLGKASILVEPMVSLAKEVTQNLNNLPHTIAFCVAGPDCSRTLGRALKCLGNFSHWVCPRYEGHNLMDNAKAGVKNLVVVGTPESLLRTEIFEILSPLRDDVCELVKDARKVPIAAEDQVCSPVKLLCFDEAHKIREWEGFRDCFHRLGQLSKCLQSWESPDFRILCLSATSTMATRRYIQKNLHFRQSNFELLQSLERSNMTLNFQLNDSKDGRGLPTKQKLSAVRSGLDKGNCVLVFVNSREKAEEVVNLIREELPEIASTVFDFHSGKPQPLLELEKQAFRRAAVGLKCGAKAKRKRPALKILVCTIAFGLGVNVPSGVYKCVIWDNPRSVSDMYQIACRCGRDVSSRRCVVALRRKKHLIPDRIGLRRRDRREYVVE